MTTVVNVSSAFVLTPDVMVIGCNPDENKVEGVRVFDLMISIPVMSCCRSSRGRGRPDIGDQRRFHVVARPATRGLVAVFAEHGDHPRLDPNVGAAGEPIFAPSFLG